VSGLKDLLLPSKNTNFWQSCFSTAEVTEQTTRKRTNRVNSATPKGLIEVGTDLDIALSCHKGLKPLELLGADALLDILQLKAGDVVMTQALAGTTLTAATAGVSLSGSLGESRIETRIERLQQAKKRLPPLGGTRQLASLARMNGVDGG